MKRKIDLNKMSRSYSQFLIENSQMISIIDGSIINISEPHLVPIHIKNEDVMRENNFKQKSSNQNMPDSKLSINVPEFKDTDVYFIKDFPETAKVYFPFKYYDFQKPKQIQTNSYLLNLTIVRKYSRLLEFLFALKSSSKLKIQLELNFIKFLNECRVTNSDLKNLEDLLIKMFSGEEIKEVDIELDPCEIVLFTILFIKRGYINYSTPCYSLTLVKIIQSLFSKININKNVTMILNQLKKKLEKKFHNKIEFENYYFQDVKKKLNIHILEFDYHINKNISIYNSSRKKISIKEFAEIISKSSKFLNELKCYIKNKNDSSNIQPIYHDFILKMKNKVNSLIKKWKKILNTPLKFKNNYVYLFHSEIRNSKKRISWTVQDIFQAILDLIYYIPILQKETLN